MKLKYIFVFFLVIIIALGGYVYYTTYAYASSETYVKRVNERFKQNDMEGAITLLEKAAKHYPQRLDFKFGKIYICQVTKDIACMQKGIEEVIEQSTKQGNAWLWLNDESVDNKFMLDSIQAYQKFFFDEQYDDTLMHTSQIILNAYPDHYESLNGVGILHLFKKDCAEAKKYLDKARNLAPTDPLIKNNYTQFLKRCPGYSYPK